MDVFRQRADGRVVMSGGEAVHHYMNKASMELICICEEEIGRRKARRAPGRPEDVGREIETTEEEIRYLEEYRDALMNEAPEKRPGWPA